MQPLIEELDPAEQHVTATERSRRRHPPGLTVDEAASFVGDYADSFIWRRPKRNEAERLIASLRFGLFRQVNEAGSFVYGKRRALEVTRISAIWGFVS